MAAVTRTAPAAATPASSAIGYQRSAGRSRVQRYRRRLLETAALGAALGLLAAVVVLTASVVTYNQYDQIAGKGVVSVDAAQDARADLLDNVGANADLLAQTDQNARASARGRAQASWLKFKDDLRRSWRNLSDQTQGEFASFNAADAAETDYAADIGAMDAAVDANNADQAHTQFLNAYTVLNQRLLPALSSGLQSVKLEDIKADYAGTSSTIRGWFTVLLVVSAALIAVAAVGLVLTRRMHFRLTWEIAAALLLALATAVWLGYQLHRADTQAKVLVHDAYDMVAGVRDASALVSQENALESIAIFDPNAAATYFTEIDQYDLQFNQLMCGAADCAKSGAFVGNAQSGGDTVNAQVIKDALDNQDKFGLAAIPLVANVHFAGEASALEAARKQYEAFLTFDAGLRTKIQQNNAAGAASDNAGPGQTQYTATVNALGAVQNVARGSYNSIWQSVENAAKIGEALTVAEVIVAGLLARGLWRRRHQLFVGGVV